MHGNTVTTKQRKAIMVESAEIALDITRMIHAVPTSQDRPSRSQTCSVYRPCDYNRRPSQWWLDTADTPANNSNDSANKMKTNIRNQNE